MIWLVLFILVFIAGFFLVPVMSHLGVRECPGYLVILGWGLLEFCILVFGVAPWMGPLR